MRPSDAKRRKRRLDTKDWREAQSKEKQLITEASEGKLTHNSTTLARLPFAQAADEYKSARKLELAPASQAKEKQLLVQLRAYFKQEPLKAITVKRITDYRTWRAEQEIGPATLNAELGILRRILKRAKLWARVADDIRPLKEPSSIGRAITEEEKQRLLKTAAMQPEWETAYHEPRQVGFRGLHGGGAALLSISKLASTSCQTFGETRNVSFV